MKNLFKYSEMPNFGCSDDRVRDEGWLIVAATNWRDSNTVTRSNHRVLYRELEKIDPSHLTWDVMRASHWAVGWVEHFIVSPDSETARYLDDTLTSLAENYPVLDETDLSMLECEEGVEC